MNHATTRATILPEIIKMISEKKLPIYIRFTYNEKEKEWAQQL